MVTLIKKYKNMINHTGEYWFFLTIILMIILIGVSFNFLAVSSRNGGRMPVLVGYSINYATS